MKYAQLKHAEWIEIDALFEADGVTYPAEWINTVSQEKALALNVRPIIEPGPPPDNAKLVGSQIVDTTDGPARHWITVPYPVEEAAIIVWQRAKAVREAECQSGCDTQFGRVDTTDASKIDMAGAALMALLAKQAGKPFSIDWTMSDNTIQTLDADGMIALGLAVGEHRQRCQLASNEIRRQIDQAAARKGATAADVFAIDLHAGYDAPASSDGDARDA